MDLVTGTSGVQEEDFGVQKNQKINKMRMKQHFMYWLVYVNY